MMLNLEVKVIHMVFVDVAPFDASVGGSFVGTNKEVIKAFAKNANIDIKYKEFNNIEEMTKSI